jgi:hypothetical protein
MFAVVLAAEYVTMLLLDGVHHASLHGQVEALLDAAVVGVISTGAFVVLQAVDAGKRVLQKRQTWINASVILLTVGGFESALHPLSENVSMLWGGVDLDVFNALLLAVFVSLITAWVMHVERLVSSPKPDESRPTLSRAVMAGALICALCLTSVSALRAAATAAIRLGT